MSADALPHAVAVERQCREARVPEGRELARAVSAVERARVAVQNADRRHDERMQRVAAATTGHAQHRNASSELHLNTMRARANASAAESREAAKTLADAEAALVRALDVARAALEQVAA